MMEAGARFHWIEGTYYIASDYLTTEKPQEPVALTGSAGTGITSGSGGHVICIDPGHQSRGDSTPEPVAPGSSETKARVTGGTSGVATGQTEYQLNLSVSLNCGMTGSKRLYRGHDKRNQ